MIGLYIVTVEFEVPIISTSESQAEKCANRALDNRKIDITDWDYSTSARSMNKRERYFSDCATHLDKDSVSSETEILEELDVNLTDLDCMSCDDFLELMKELIEKQNKKKEIEEYMDSVQGKLFE